MKENQDELLNVQEVAIMTGRSIQTIASWYRWKKLHPRDEFAKKLPAFTRVGKKKTRYWKREDVMQLIDFSQEITKGRNGKMGQVTQRYVTNSRWNPKSDNYIGKTTK